MDRQVIRNKSFFPPLRGVAGFTLVELMVALAVGSIIMAAVMTAFHSQHETYVAQGQVVEVQQNARVAMDMMVSDIRSAGYDPNNLGAGITVAGAQALSFTREDDLPANGLETISYSLYDAFTATVPPANDGLVDDLARQVTTAASTTTGRQMVAENINQLEFRYLDENGAPTATLADIRSVQVSALFLSAQAEPAKNPGRNIYTTPAGAQWQAPAGFWNLYLTTTVQCRNLGL